MNNKRLQVIIALSLLVCLIVIFVVGFSLKKDNLKPERNISEPRFKDLDDYKIKAIETEDGENNKFYINVSNEIVDYELTIDETGICVLKNSKTDSNEKFFTLLDDEFNKVKLILNYIGEKNSLREEDSYAIYYDEDIIEVGNELEDKKYILKTTTAIENISLGEEIVDGKTKKEFGNELLDQIIEDLQLNNITNERPAN